MTAAVVHKPGCWCSVGACCSVLAAEVLDAEVIDDDPPGRERLQATALSIVASNTHIFHLHHDRLWRATTCRVP